MKDKKKEKHKKLKFKILHLLKFIPDFLMLKIQYRIKFKRKLNIQNPGRYTEKLQIYKMRYHNPLMTICSDKYLVRKYIHDKNLSNILVNLYAVYDKPEDIDFIKLPNKFVIKVNNGSGTNIFCHNKSNINVANINKLLKEWLKRDNYAVGREWAYKNIKPKIVIEQLLENDDSRNQDFTGINDYKFLCFDGEPRYVVLDVDRHVNHKRNIYDTSWNFIDVKTDHENFGDVVKKPAALDEMLEIARILSHDFPAVRVDLYYVNNKIYFGEMTFYPWTGYVQFDPDSFDYQLGDYFILQEYIS